mmetsp:Transcript_766/g.1857  ORF Transcript_766/g.1857 Transcript_766/m.1857 type:complete len:693 (+) Transcript_766:55-2133(+)
MAHYRRVRQASLSPEICNISTGEKSPESQEGDESFTLGPPLQFLPKDIELGELQAYREDYQAFRVGHVQGAKGELSQLVAGSPLERRTICQRRSGWSPQSRVVPLLSLKLSSTSAALSALTAASEHHGQTPDVAGQNIKVRRGLSGLEAPSSGGKSDGEAERLSSLEEVGSAKLGEIPGTPWRKGLPLGVSAQHGVGILVHASCSLTCLLPCLVAPEPHWSHCLMLPVLYSSLVILAALQNLRLQGSLQKFSLRSFDLALGETLQMDRVVEEGCVPLAFPRICIAVYMLLAWELALSRTFAIESSSGHISMWSKTPHRHDYSCWGSEAADVADCVLVRHSACTMLVSLYTCLFAVAACNRRVKGVEMASLHRDSLLDAFPTEARGLFSFIDRSVENNDSWWRVNQGYRVQTLATSIVWTVGSFALYAGLILHSRSHLSRAVFLSAIPSTFFLQVVLLRHVMLRVLLYMEAIKARSAALAYCDEEGVLPFTTAQSVYVWFSVRRNIQAQDEVAYQRVKPVFVVALGVAAASSGWVVLQLWQRGLSVYVLTSSGGASLMVVAIACVSCYFVGIFLGMFQDIGRLDEANIRQLRVAQLRLEHERLRAVAVELVGSRPNSPKPVDAGPHSSDLLGALSMIDKVVLLLENNDSKPTILGIEIGSSSFQVAYAAFMSNTWYLMVWGVIIPLMSAGGGE